MNYSLERTQTHNRELLTFPTRQRQVIASKYTYGVYQGPIPDIIVSALILISNYNSLNIKHVWKKAVKNYFSHIAEPYTYVSQCF